MEFVPEHLRDEAPPKPVEFVMHPDIEAMNSLSDSTRIQFELAPDFVQEQGIGYAIKNGFVTDSAPFATKRVALETGTPKCMFEFDPNITTPHIADQLATKVEQALQDPENGRVELYSTKHQKPLADLSHATVLSDINFARDVEVRRHPDLEPHDPKVLIAAQARSNAAPKSVDEAEEFADNIACALGHNVAHMVVVKDGNWGRTARVMAGNRCAMKRCVIMSTAGHAKYGRGRFCDYLRRFGCPAQLMTSVVTGFLSTALRAEAAVFSAHHHCVDLDNIRNTFATRVSDIVRCGLLGWMREYALNYRKTLRSKTPYRDCNEDALGLKTASSSDDDTSSSDDDCVDLCSAPRSLRTMQQQCSVCHLPRYRCHCRSAYAIRTDAYGRINAPISAPQSLIGPCAKYSGRQRAACYATDEWKRPVRKSRRRRSRRKGDAIGDEIGSDEEEEDIGAQFEDAILNEDEDAVDDLLVGANPFVDGVNWFRKKCNQWEPKAPKLPTIRFERKKKCGDEAACPIQRKKKEEEEEEEAEEGGEEEAGLEEEEEKEEAFQTQRRSFPPVETSSGVVLSEGGLRTVQQTPTGLKFRNPFSRKNTQKPPVVESGSESDEEEEEEEKDSDEEEEFTYDQETPTASSSSSSSSTRPTRVYASNGTPITYEGGIPFTSHGGKAMLDESGSGFFNATNPAESAVIKNYVVVEDEEEEEEEEDASVNSQYWVDESVPAKSTLFGSMLARRPNIATEINPSGSAMDAFVFMPHDNHANIDKFLSLNKGGSAPLVDYLRSATIEVPKGTRLGGVSSKLSVNGKRSYSVDPNGFTVNEMTIGYDIKKHGSNIFVVPTSFVLRE